jgi:hypothetical protein
MPARGLWSPNYWSGFVLTMCRDVATRMGRSCGVQTLDCGMYVDDGGGAARRAGMALAPDPMLKRLAGLLRLIRVRSSLTGLVATVAR